MSLAQLIAAALPQTQCTRCGEPDCARYAEAIVAGAPINRCPPGGQAGVHRLAQLTGRPELPLDPGHGQEGPRQLAWIDEAACIGCTLCITACPVDAIVGAPKRMHTVLDAWCTGCELCIPACPVDCIHLEVVNPRLSGWDAWSPELAAEAHERYQQRQHRLDRESAQEAARLASRAISATVPAPDTPHAALATPSAATRSTTARVPDPLDRQMAIAAALARSRARRAP